MRHSLKRCTTSLGNWQRHTQHLWRWTFLESLKGMLHRINEITITTWYSGGKQSEMLNECSCYSHVNHVPCNNVKPWGSTDDLAMNPGHHSLGGITGQRPGSRRRQAMFTPQAEQAQEALWKLGLSQNWGTCNYFITILILSQFNEIKFYDVFIMGKLW